MIHLDFTGNIVHPRSRAIFGIHLTTGMHMHYRTHVVAWLAIVTWRHVGVVVMSHNFWTAAGEERMYGRIRRDMFIRDPTPSITSHLTTENGKTVNTYNTAGVFSVRQ